MKTDFTILWVDDHRDFANSIIAELGKWLDEKGFLLKVVMHKDETGVLDNIRKLDIELIIIDYKLPKKSGDEIIQDIREKAYYQDIVFYSEGDLPLGAFDGVFFSSKEDAKGRIKGLIELKLRRTTDPASIRGWIVADAIELEAMLTELIISCYTQREEFAFTERLFYDDKNPLDFSVKHHIFSGILKDHISLLRSRGTEKEKIEQVETLKGILNSFQSEIIEIRNIVAHKRIEETQDGRAIRRRSVNVLDEATIIQIRKNLRKHRDNLIALQQFM